MTDMINCYCFFLGKKINDTFNVGFENYTINSIAEMIKKNLKKTKINRNKSLDVRSYRLYAGKLLKFGFSPLKNANDAIKDIIINFGNKKILNKKTNLRSIYLNSYLKK